MSIQPTTTSQQASSNVEKSTSAENQVLPSSKKSLIYYSLGSSSAEQAQGLINVLLYPIFNMTLGISPGAIGSLQGVLQFLSAFWDPAIAQITDRTHTKWGRRMPFILVGGVSCAIIITIFFWVNSDWNKTAILIWLGGFLLLFNLSAAILSVPYYALGIEMGCTYDERTRVVAYRSIISKVTGIANSWFFAFTQLFSNGLVGARWLAGIVGLVGLGTTLALVTQNKEPVYTPISKNEKKPGLLKTIGSVLGNKVYCKLLFIWTIVGLSMGIFGAIGSYLSIYYVFHGDMLAGATLGGYAGTLGLIVAAAGIPITKKLCDLWGKHRVLTLALWLYIIGSILKWWCVNPNYPYLLLVIPFFFSLGISSYYLVMSAMQADVVDMDELLHGERRAGMFGAVGGLIMKLGAALSVFLSGWVVVWCGFDIKFGGEQPDGVFLAMRICFSVIPAIGCALGLLAIRNWPLTRERCLAMSEELATRRKNASCGL